MATDPLEVLRLPVVAVQPRSEFAANLLRRIRQERAPIRGRGATVRYFVGDLEAAVAFYCETLGFEEELRSSHAFAMLHRGELRLLLSVPGLSHHVAGATPDPGGWNRILLQVDDLTATVQDLSRQGVRFRHGVVRGAAVRSALLEDPSGNPVELFEPLAAYHEREGG
jgi:catechol 2,3-dioxygenase-like lactoylglutathione lyase family enzyme